MSILSDEIINDPLGRVYSGMTNAEVVADMNLMIYEGKGSLQELISYLIQNRSRTNSGTDTIATSILGRLKMVADSKVGDNPFGATGGTLTLEYIHSANMFMVILFSPLITEVSFVDTEIIAMLDSLTDGKVWKVGDVTALKALSQNKKSRAMVLGIGRVREGHVQEARI